MIFLSFKKKFSFGSFGRHRVRIVIHNISLGYRSWTSGTVDANVETKLTQIVSDLIGVINYPRV